MYVTNDYYIIILLSTISFICFSQENQTIVIRAGNMVDTENGMIIRRQLIYIQGEYITDIKPDKGEAIANADVIFKDVGGQCGRGWSACSQPTLTEH